MATIEFSSGTDPLHIWYTDIWAPPHITDGPVLGAYPASASLSDSIDPAIFTPFRIDSPKEKKKTSVGSKDGCMQETFSPLGDTCVGSCAAPDAGRHGTHPSPFDRR